MCFENTVDVKLIQIQQASQLKERIYNLTEASLFQKLITNERMKNFCQIVQHFSVDILSFMRLNKSRSVITIQKLIVSDPVCSEMTVYFARFSFENLSAITFLLCSDLALVHNLVPHSWPPLEV